MFRRLKRFLMVKSLVLLFFLCLAHTSTARHPGTPELRELQDSIWRWKAEHPGDPLADNIRASAQMTDRVEVTLILADSGFRSDFHARVHDSPRIQLTGFDPGTMPWPAAPEVTADSAACASMRADKHFYPSGTEYVDLMIRNDGDRELFFGEDYTVCRFKHGRWEILPTQKDWHAVLHGLHTGEEYRFRAWLAPQIYPARYDRYRVCKAVYTDDSHCDLLLGAEFTLTPFVPFTRFEK